MANEDWLVLDKTAFGVSKLHEPPDERQFWHAKNPPDRLLAVEQMRQIIYGYRQPAPRLQRVFEITQRERH